MVFEGKGDLVELAAPAVLPGHGDLPHRARLRLRRRRLPRRARPEVEGPYSERDMLLSVRDLQVRFDTDDGVVQAVDGVSFDVAPRRDVRDRRRVGFGQVGHGDEHPRPHPEPRRCERRKIVVEGDDLLQAERGRACARIRGGEIAMIFQDPLTALNPVHKIGRQIGEMVRIHRDASKKQARERAIETARPRRHPAAGTARRQLPARVLRRHAPAGDDRDGDRVRARPAHRRRADHRARRDGPGAGARRARCEIKDRDRLVRSC